MFRCCVALFSIFTSAFAQRAFTPEDTIAVHSIGELAPSPDGKIVLFSVDGALMRVAGGEAEAVKGAPKGPSSVRWSPDGTRIAFFHENALWTMEMRSGKLTRV